MNRRTKIALLGALVAATSARVARADDVVMLKNGGRLRGEVMSEDPKAGVKIKLADGRIRTLKPAEVDRVVYEDEPKAAPPPAPPPPPPPPYPPRGVVDEEPPTADYAAARRGAHVGISAGITTVIPELIGATAGFVANFGVHPNVDVRTGLRLGAGSWPGGSPAGYFEVPLSVRFNIGSVYTIVVGFAAGALISSNCELDGNCFATSGSTKPYAMFGPELSFTTFRFGPRREIELEILGGCAIVSTPGSTLATGIGVISSSAAFLPRPRMSIGINYLFL